VTLITLRAAASRGYRRARLSALAGGGAFGSGAELATRACRRVLTPRWRAAINLILDRIDERISKLEAKP
jgi:hypothetical protein